MQYALEKILLPSLISQAEPPAKLRSFITWTLDKGLPILKASNIAEIQNLKKFNIDRKQLESFLNSYVDQQKLNTPEKLKQFRDSHVGIDRNLQKKFEDYGKAYAIRNPFQILGLKGDFESKLSSAKKEIKPFLQQNGLSEQKLIGCILGLLVWSIQNFNPSLTAQKVLQSSNKQTPNAESSETDESPTSDNTMLFVGIGGLLLTAIGVGAFVILRKPKKAKRRNF